VSKKDYQGRLLKSVIGIAHQAGKKILENYLEPLDVSYKEDNSPITIADKEAHEHILLKLQDLTPDIPIVSEEGGNQDVKESEFWLVDPLDGTKEFIQRNDEFTVNISLIKDNLPILGVVCAPALSITYGGIVGDRAFKITSDGKCALIQVQPNASKGIIVVASRNHGDCSREEKFLSLLPNSNLMKVGSSLKFCKIAEGAAHMYPRFGRTMEWDTAAGQAILMAAGGFIYSIEGNILTYGKKDWENPCFVAASSIDLLRGGGCYGI
jgi:3'(2'), 5'-bisphosphate nucleotidase